MTNQTSAPGVVHDEAWINRAVRMPDGRRVQVWSPGCVETLMREYHEHMLQQAKPDDAAAFKCIDCGGMTDLHAEHECAADDAPLSVGDRVEVVGYTRQAGQTGTVSQHLNGKWFEVEHSPGHYGNYRSDELRRNPAEPSAESDDGGSVRFRTDGTRIWDDGEIVASSFDAEEVRAVTDLLIGVEQTRIDNHQRAEAIITAREQLIAELRAELETVRRERDEALSNMKRMIDIADEARARARQHGDERDAAERALANHMRQHAVREAS